MAIFKDLVKAEKSLGGVKGKAKIAGRSYSDDPIEFVNDAIRLGSAYIDTIEARKQVAEKAINLLLDVKTNIEKGNSDKALANMRQIWKLARNKDEIFNGWSMGNVANDATTALSDLENVLEL